MHLITPPVGSALLLESGMSPSALGYAGTWQRLHINLINAGSHKSLDVAGGSKDDGANIDLYTTNWSMAQSWYLGAVKADTTERYSLFDLWVRTA